LETPIGDDRAKFTRSLRSLIGMDGRAYAKLWGAFWEQYEAPVTAERAAREIGVTQEVFRMSLLAHLKANGQIDTVLGGFLRNVPIPRYQFLEVYSVAQEIVANYGSKHE
jgi:hypothetical protein